MKWIFIIALSSISNLVWGQTQLTDSLAYELSNAPLKCIDTEFPNKTSHLADNFYDATLLPHELHPIFFGCLDWHSSVHSHWLLVRLLNKYPDLKNQDQIIKRLSQSFIPELVSQEAAYFGKYTASNSFERTYGWAWLLKLDEELYHSTIPEAKIWRKNLAPLTQKIVKLWKDYLPLMTYANRTGVHSNSAFGLGFAIDWATVMGDVAFRDALVKKSMDLYYDDKKIPAYLEPNGSDFFSPSLMVADLMTRILNTSDYVRWINKYFDKRGVEQICTLPIVSSREDYQIVHLDGLSFSRAWCMKKIAQKLPPGHSLKNKFAENATITLSKTLPNVFSNNYGGEHWLNSFAIYALDM